MAGSRFVRACPDHVCARTPHGPVILGPPLWTATGLSGATRVVVRRDGTRYAAVRADGRRVPIDPATGSHAAAFNPVVGVAVGAPDLDASCTPTVARDALGYEFLGDAVRGTVSVLDPADTTTDGRVLPRVVLDGFDELIAVTVDAVRGRLLVLERSGRLHAYDLPSGGGDPDASTAGSRACEVAR